MFMNTKHTLGALAPNRNEMKRIECERSCFAKMCPYPSPSKKKHLQRWKLIIHFIYNLVRGTFHLNAEARTDAHTSKCLQWKSLDSFQLAKGTDTPGPLVNEFCKRRFKLIAYNSVCIVDSAAIDSFRWGIWFL